MSEELEGIDGTNEFADIVIHLMEEHPTHWSINLPLVTHRPSGTMFAIRSNWRVELKDGRKFSWRDSRRINAQVVRLIGVMMLISSREHVLRGERNDYMMPLGGVSSFGPSTVIGKKVSPNDIMDSVAYAKLFIKNQREQIDSLRTATMKQLANNARLGK